MKHIIAIGLDENFVQRIRVKSDKHIICYPNVPRAYSVDGELYVESPTVMDKWLNVAVVLFYGYWDGDEMDFLYSVALSNAKSFPNIRTAIQLSDKKLNIVRFLQGPYISHFGYIPKDIDINFDREMVCKWGNRHCGEDKELTTKSITDQNQTVESFIEGNSIRALWFGDYLWKIQYESDDWRKNINPKISYKTADALIDKAFYYNALDIRNLFGRPFVAGIDFIEKDGKYYFLEINAFPGLDDVPEAHEAFANFLTLYVQNALYF